MRNLLKVSSYLLAALGMIYCLFSFVQSYQSVPDVAFNLGFWTKMVLIEVWYLFSMLLYFEGSRQLISSDGVTVKYGRFITIMGMSQICKYIPGNIFHYTSRVALILNQGISAATVTISVALEPLIAFTVAGFLVLVGANTDPQFQSIFISLVRLKPSSIEPLDIFLVGIAVCVFFCITLRKIKGWVKRLYSYWKLLPVIKVVIIYFALFCLNGIIIKTLPWALWDVFMNLSFSQVVWRFSLCWIAGFIVPGAPAGLGVREALFVQLFAADLGEGVAASMALILRLISIVGDILVFVFSWGIGKRFLLRGEDFSAGRWTAK